MKFGNDCLILQVLRCLPIHSPALWQLPLESILYAFLKNFLRKLKEQTMIFKTAFADLHCYKCVCACVCVSNEVSPMLLWDSFEWILGHPDVLERSLETGACAAKQITRARFPKWTFYWLGFLGARWALFSPRLSWAQMRPCWEDNLLHGGSLSYPWHTPHTCSLFPSHYDCYLLRDELESYIKWKIPEGMKENVHMALSIKTGPNLAFWDVFYMTWGRKILTRKITLK